MNRRELLKATVGTCVGVCLPFVGKTKAKAKVEWATKEPGDLHLRFFIPDPSPEVTTNWLAFFTEYCASTNVKEFVGYPPMTLVVKEIRWDRVWKYGIAQYKIQWGLDVVTPEENPFRERSIDFNCLPFPHNQPVEVTRYGRTVVYFPSYQMETCLPDGDLLTITVKSPVS